MRLIIGFTSKAFDERMKRWDVPQKEGYAIYYAFDKWDYLLKDRFFILKTDHEKSHTTERKLSEQ
jgi:phage terminase large subunit-like protein